MKKVRVLDGFAFFRMKDTSINMNKVHKSGEVIEVDEESYEYTSQSFKVEVVKDKEAPAPVSAPAKTAPDQKKNKDK
jgi:hypothetical protein